MKKIEFSIIITTFNQEKYIEKAIQSVLNQKTEFYYEILIGDDFSTDNTKEICIKYAQAHPDKIILESRIKNLGLIENYIDLLKKSKGKYIAFLEGDDYWIDNSKIQSQFDFLEKNNYGLVYTNSYILKDNLSKKKKKYENNLFNHSGNLHQSLLRANHIVAITISFRRDLIIKKIIDDYDHIKNFKTIDYYIILMISKYFEIGYLNKLTSVYRVHNESISNSNNFKKKKIFLDSTYNIKNLFLKRERADLKKIRTFQSRYFYDLFIISLNHEIVGVDNLDIDLKKVENIFLNLYFNFNFIRKFSQFIIKLKNFSLNKLSIKFLYFL